MLECRENQGCEWEVGQIGHGLSIGNYDVYSLNIANVFRDAKLMAQLASSFHSYNNSHTYPHSVVETLRNSRARTKKPASRNDIVAAFGPFSSMREVTAEDNESAHQHRHS